MPHSRRLSPALLALALCAPLLAQGSSRLERRQIAIPRGLYFDFDAQTVLSRARVGDLVADIQLVRRGQGLAVRALGDAKVAESSPLEGDALVALLDGAGDEAIAPGADAWFYARTDRGNYARAQVLYVDMGLSMQEALEVGLLVTYQRDGSARFPAPVEELASSYSDGTVGLRWQDGVEAQVWLQAFGEEGWKDLGTGTGSLDIPGLLPDTPYTARVARVIPEVGLSEPLTVALYTANGLIWGEASWSQDFGNGEVELRFDGREDGDPDLRLRTWGQLFIEAGPGAGIVRVKNGLGDFYGLASLPTDGFRAGSQPAAGGDIFAFRDRYGRTGKLLVSTENWWNGRVIYMLSKDGASTLPEGPAEISETVADATATLTWPAVEGAVGYRVYRVEDLGKQPVLVKDVSSPEAVLDALEPFALYRCGVSWIDGDGRESAMHMVEVDTFPESWRYGTFSLKANTGYDFATGENVEYTGNEEVDIATWDSEGYSLFGTWGLSQPYAWGDNATPPPFGKIDLNAREYLQNVQQNIYLDPNGPGAFWIKTKSGDYVQAQVVSRSGNRMAQQWGGMAGPGMGVVEWSEDQQQGSTIFEYVYVHLDSDTRLEILAANALPLSEKQLAKIPELLVQLDDPDPDVRDGAEKELVAMDTGVVPHLKKALDEGLSFEAEFRVLRVVDELWNKPVAMMDEWGAVAMPLVAVGEAFGGGELEWPFGEEIFEELGSNPWDDVALDETASYHLDLSAFGLAAGSATASVSELNDGEVILEFEVTNDFTSELSSGALTTDQWLWLPASLFLGQTGKFSDDYSIADEELTIGELTYETKKVTLDYVSPETGMEGTMHLWYDATVPVFGLVRLEVEIAGTSLSLELEPED